jgi:hypothetical protein
MLELEVSYRIEFPRYENEIFDQIIHNHLSFTYDIKYILIETMFTHRLLKKKNEYVYKNLRKELENNQEVVIVETDLDQDPKIQNVPIIKDTEFYKTLMKNFNGYVAFKYHGPVNQIKQCIEYLNSLRYCDFCSFNMVYQIDLYKLNKDGESLNFIYVKVLTA